LVGLFIIDQIADPGGCVSARFRNELVGRAPIKKMVATNSVKEIQNRILFIILLVSWWSIDNEIDRLITRRTLKGG